MSDCIKDCMKKSTDDNMIAIVVPAIILFVVVFIKVGLFWAIVSVIGLVGTLFLIMLINCAISCTQGG